MAAGEFSAPVRRVGISSRATHAQRRLWPGGIATVVERQFGFHEHDDRHGHAGREIFAADLRDECGALHHRVLLSGQFVESAERAGGGVRLV